MAGRECFHCGERIAEGQAHDCWTTTEAALTAELPEDLRDAWDRLRETLADFGDQRIYASHSSIMFARKACYAFVRPKTKFLEVFFFLGRSVHAPQIRRSMASSRVKVAHEVRVTHRDQVEAPLTDWIREAYDTSDELTARGKAAPAAATKKSAAKKASPRRTPARKSRSARARSARR